MNKCPTCGKPDHLPYRRRDKAGNITEGCVDAFHTGHLAPGASLDWHQRKEAVQARQDAAKRLRLILL